MATTSQLESLPWDIRVDIIRLTDPVGLISLSQTNTSLRRIIKPTRQHFVERMLAQECLPEIGGPEYIFHNSGNTVWPKFHREEWDDIRLACTGCMRFLHHINFTHQHIARMPFRKPIRGSPADITVTSWEPSLRGKMSGKRQWQQRIESGEMAERRQMMRRYTVAREVKFRTHNDRGTKLSEYQGCGMKRFQQMPIDKFRRMSWGDESALLEEEIHDVDLLLSGYDRRLRRCNECCFQTKANNLNKWKFHQRTGTKEVPILHKCKGHYVSPAERWFPGVVSKLNGPRPRVSPRWIDQYLQSDHTLLAWNMWSVRCPGCCKWQEARALRLCDSVILIGVPQRYFWSQDDTENQQHPHFKQIQSSRCNQCVVEQNGTGTLQNSLTKCLRSVIHHEMLGAQLYLLQSLPSDMIQKELPHRFQEFRRSNEQSTNKTTHRIMQIWNREEAEEVWSWRVYLNSPDKKKVDELMREYMAERWWRVQKDAECNDIYELWTWLKGCDETLDGSGAEALVDWALSRNPGSVQWWM